MTGWRLCVAGVDRREFDCDVEAAPVLLSLLGGVVGIGVGAAPTAVYASTKHWDVVIPTRAWAGGLAATLAIGAIAGLLPALRAARLSPTQAALGRLRRVR